MNGYGVLTGIPRLCSALMLTSAASTGAFAAELNLIHTNAYERTITNQIEVLVPVNHFVNEYHTNRVEILHTNSLEVFSTNRITQVLTNKYVVDLYQTNYSVSYLTNVKTFQATNWTAVVTYKTNFLTHFITNLAVIDLFHTNYVTSYVTNSKTLNLTNWSTVLAFRTNWVSQPVTNTVAVDMVRPGGPGTSAPAPVAAVATVNEPASTPIRVATLTDTVTFEAARTEAPIRDNQVEVRLRARWKSDEHAPLQVQQWRVERGDGSVLLFGKAEEFRHALPVGDYKIEVRTQKSADGPLLAARGTLAVTSGFAIAQASPLRK